MAGLAKYAFYREIIFHCFQAAIYDKPAGFYNEDHPSPLRAYSPDLLQVQEPFRLFEELRSSHRSSLMTFNM